MPGMKAFFTKEAGDSALSEGCRAALSDFTSSADNTFTGIIQTVTSKLNLWINPIVDRATAESDFSLTDLRRIPTSHYLGVSPDEIDRVAPPHNLFLQPLLGLNPPQIPDDGKKLDWMLMRADFAGHSTDQALSIYSHYVRAHGL